MDRADALHSGAAGSSAAAVGTATGPGRKPEGTAYQLYFLERTLADADGGDALPGGGAGHRRYGCTAEETRPAAAGSAAAGTEGPAAGKSVSQGNVPCIRGAGGNGAAGGPFGGLWRAFRRGTVAGGLCHHADTDPAPGCGPGANHRAGGGAGLPQPAGIFEPGCAAGPQGGCCEHRGGVAVLPGWGRCADGGKADAESL